MARPLLVIAMVILGIAWAILVLSSHGILYADAVERGRGDAKLTCRYFTGLGLTRREYWYSETGMGGRDVCPRLISFK